jgi:hypothetical protein
VCSVAWYPVADLSINPRVKSVRKPKNPMPPWLASLFNDCYVPDVAMGKDHRVSPGLASKHGFPGEVVVVTCEGDTLAPESRVGRWRRSWMMG